MQMERAVDDWAVSESERWLSIIAGSMLGLAALRRGSLGGLLLGTAAGFLIHRGVTGHCVVGETIFGELDAAGSDAPDAGDAASDAPSWTPTTSVEPGDED
jgi:uncharacterized membrane protein